MTAEQPDYKNLIHTPADLGAEYLAWAEKIRSDPGIQFGVSAIDRVVIPMRAGELISLIARPAHGKTSLLAYFARIEAQRIIAREMEQQEAVVYVTWEQSAEELEAFFQADGEHSISDIAWGRADLDVIRRQAVKRAGVPIWVIGHGIGRAGKRSPRMTPEIVLDAIEGMALEFHGVKPTLVIFDYMQLIPVPGFRDRVQQVTEVPICIKELALRIGCPAIVGVQARREVDDRAIKIPEMRDAQWASSIEQTSDKVFGLWRPCVTETHGDIIDIGTDKYTVNDRLLIIRMLKQRGDRGRHTWGMYFAPEYLKLAEMETKTAAETPGSWWD
jgi:replicative DNA helicase